jgi:hypothetical protein
MQTDRLGASDNGGELRGIGVHIRDHPAHRFDEIRLAGDLNGERIEVVQRRIRRRMLLRGILFVVA